VLWWALATGADFGGSLTVVGASSNIVGVAIARGGIIAEDGKVGQEHVVHRAADQAVSAPSALQPEPEVRGGVADRRVVPDGAVKD
jgi:hypothetical protein